MGAFGDAVAAEVLGAFDDLPAKSKPVADAHPRPHWVALCGIVAGLSNGTLRCIALATGTKCLPEADVREAKGRILHDSHAEILALRALNHFLLCECRRLAESPDDAESDYVRRRDADDSSGSVGPLVRAFAFREEVGLHMYCSEAPCGDASMELTMRAQLDASPWGRSRGESQKEEEEEEAEEEECSPAGGARLLGRGYFSELGIVRRKPARGDSAQTLSKSCSDKLALKQVVSVLGSPACLVMHPAGAYLQSLIISSPSFVAKACHRAFSEDGRLAKMDEKAWEGGFGFRPFRVLTTERAFAYQRSRDDGALPACSNKSAIWNPVVQETVIGGVKQGFKRSDPRGASVVSRLKLVELVAGILTCSQSMTPPVHWPWETYRTLKDAKALELRRRVKEYVQSSVLPNWRRNVEDDFEIKLSNGGVVSIRRE